MSPRSLNHESPRLAPTGELHRDPLTPFQAADWARRLAIPELHIRQLAAEVGPVFADIERAWKEQMIARVTADELRKAQRQGRLVT